MLAAEGPCTDVNFTNLFFKFIASLHLNTDVHCRGHVFSGAACILQWHFLISDVCQCM